MIREIQRQHMDICNDRDSGFFIADITKIVYINECAAKMFNTDEKAETFVDKLDVVLAEKVKESIGKRKGIFTKNLEIAGGLYDASIFSCGGYALVSLHRKTDCDKYYETAGFKAKIIDALAAYQRTIFNTIKMFMMNKTGDTDKHIENTVARALKVNAAISEMSQGIQELHYESKVCNLSKMIDNAITNIKRILDSISIEFIESEESTTVFCNETLLEKAIYNAVSALLYGKKSGKIEIEVQNVNGRDLLAIRGVDVIWNECQKAYVYGDRKDCLQQDIHTYGYDILCASNLMDMQGGKLLVKTGEHNTEVFLSLPDMPDSYEEILRSAEEKYLDEEDACIILSDIL